MNICDLCNKELNIVDVHFTFDKNNKLVRKCDECYTQTNSLIKENPYKTQLKAIKKYALTLKNEEIVKKLLSMIDIDD